MSGCSVPSRVVHSRCLGSAGTQTWGVQRGMREVPLSANVHRDLLAWPLLPTLLFCGGWPAFTQSDSNSDGL